MDPQPPLAELHLHLAGCVRPSALLEQLATCEPDLLVWDDYDAAMEAAYGAVPPARELIERHRAGDPSAGAEFARLFVVDEQDAGDFAKFSAKYELLFVASDRTGSPLAVRTEMDALLAGIRADHAAQGITHAELRILLGPDLRSEENAAVVDALLAGLDAHHRLVLSLDRADPWPGWERVQELALGPDGDRLVGIDFCAREEGHPPKDVAALLGSVAEFNRAHPDRALAVLYHVGESFTDKSLESAIRWVQEAAELGAHRLGHAIALGIDPNHYGEHTRTESITERLDQIEYDLQYAAGLTAAGVRVDPRALHAERSALQDSADAVVTITYDRARLEEVRARQGFAIERVAATGAVVEVCPTSNFLISGLDDPANHPVHRFFAEGLPFVVSTDDPGIFGTTLEAELDWVCDQLQGGAPLRSDLVRRAWAARSEVLSGRVAHRHDGLNRAGALEWAQGVVGPVRSVRELSGGWTSTMLALDCDGPDSFVLRLMTREPWRSHGVELTTRESEVQHELAGTPVPAPRTVALDAEGRHCGVPAHLMTLLPGAVDLERRDLASLSELADVLATIHEVRPAIPVRAYQSWAWEAKYRVPRWARDRRLWEEAFELLRHDAPGYAPTFLHRDFQPRNVLWAAGHVAGVVDWVEASTGPAWLDVAHCATHLAITHDDDAAEEFAAAYVARTGTTPQPYFDVIDVVGVLPAPGRAAYFEDDGVENRRLEDRLRSVMRSL